MNRTTKHIEAREKTNHGVFKQNPMKVGFLLFMLLLNVISIFGDYQLLADVTAPVLAFGAAFIIYQEQGKRGDGVYLWLFFFALTWGIADISWLSAVHVFGTDPITSEIIWVLYLIPSFLLVIMVAMLYYQNLDKWNRYQLMLDALVVFSMVLVLLWNLIGSITASSLVETRILVIIGIYHLSDVFIVSGMIILHVSTRQKRKDIGILYIFAGILVFFLSNVIYSYQVLNGSFVPNSVVSVLYFLPLVGFSLAALHQRPKEKKDTLEEYSFPENYGRIAEIKYVIGILAVLWIVQAVEFIMFIVLSLILILHKFFSAYIQLSIKNAYLLRKEQEANLYLEKQIEEKTRDLQQAKSVLEEYSYLDKLTGLKNRRSFVDYMDQLTREKEQHFSLFYMDLDRFKFINDAHGHEIGDRVLVHLSEQLLSSCKVDCELFRIGGDEFAVVLPKEYSKTVLENIANEIITSVQKPIEIPPYTFHVGISIGIARYPLDADNREDLMKYGDMTMYEAKNDRRNKGYLFFNEQLQREMEYKHEIEMMLKKADYDQEFHLVFQPQYRIEDQKMIGLETLLRWKQPEKGAISPKDFIPIAEETGQIISIGEWVMGKALEEIKIFNEKHDTNLKIAVNVSPVQIQNLDFLPWIEKKIQEKQVHPYWLDIEITEGATIHREFSMEEIFTGLAKLGISASIDDFGTGYSSLSYIKRFHIDRLKIAKELIDHIAEDENSRLIIQAITMMAEGMGLSTIAEGVEDTKQLKILKEMGCDQIQGYLWGKPKSMAAVERDNVVIQKAAEH